MENERRILLSKVRNYLLDNPSEKINLLEVSNNIGCQLNEITKLADSSTALIKLILELKCIELQEILDAENNETDSAIDGMIYCGQEIFEKFESISPVRYACIRKANPELYAGFKEHKLGLIKEHLEKNLKKGIEVGEYKDDINASEIIEKYMERIRFIHSDGFLNSGNFTFANLFSNIFEDYLEEVATIENWNYFRKRKQFFEAISFVNR